MMEENERPIDQAQNQDAAPLNRKEMQAGLRAVHELLIATQDDSTTANAYAQALAFLLVNKGILRPDEMQLMMRQVRRKLMQDPAPRVRLGTTRDKYTAAGSVDIDCASLIPICKGRCCTFVFCLTKQDLDEGVVRWDYGNPYWIKQTSDGFCAHSDPATHLCTIHAQRPFICRKFDCRNDKRLWLDFEARIPAPPLPAPGDDPVAMAELLLHEEEVQAKMNRMDSDE